MDWNHSFLALCGFLEHSNAETDWQGSLHKPLPLFQPTPIDFGYHTSISRNLETGEISFADQDCITYDLCSEGHGEKAVSKDPLSMRDVINLNDELHRRLKNTFTLRTASIPGVSQDASQLFEEQEILEHLLSSNPLSGIIASGLTNTSSEVDQPNFRHLEMETKLLLMKRMRQAEPVKRYAVLEDTSQQLPKFSVLIKDPAYTWPFELDTFQKQAILCLERNQSVFVAAHTSAGKTVVAEYASAMCRRRGSRVIYTSPIKALSNQKFHDFRKTFGEDVGLLTGDIKVATDSSLLVMTTEILYNMLCSAADAIRDLEIVIMDEVHYLNDAERGHVWEQIMIMLPKHVLLVMLSATVPNTLEFADWLGRIRDSEIHVVATDRRPVPLEHYLFTGLDGQATDQHLHLLVDQNGNFRSSGYNQAIFTYKASKLKKLPKPPGENSRAEELAAAGRGQAGKGVGSGAGNSGSKPAKAFTGGKFNTPGRWNYMPSSDGISVREKRTKTMWLGVVRMLQEQKLMPAIAFGFSRNSLEVLAGHLSSVDLLTKNEKNQVRQFLRLSIMKRLKGPDAHLPSVLFITDLVRRGLALHHAGMLPLLKETVEMLFQRGLVRLLFATETFAMGVNMPARCVLFSTLEKFDGRRHRPLNPGEYTQMAGRAGRRGLDPSGTVIIMVEGIGRSLVSPVLGVPSEGTLSSIILGTPTRLASQFKITYSMILHLHRTNWLSPQDVMRRSFMEAPALRREIERRQWLARLKARLENTTTLIPSAGASSTSALSWTSKSTSLGSTSVPVGEPVLQVKCPFGQEECAEEMASYYQACCKFRQLSATLSLVLADQPMTDLQRVFCPGRLLFVQLPASDPKCIRASHSLPNWLVPAMVVDLCKTTVQGQTEVHWNLITWQPSDRLPTRTSHPPYHQVLPVNDVAAAAENIPDSESSGVCTDLKADVDDEAEEDVLCDGEDCWMKPTPFPPQLMPLFIPESFDDSLARLTLMSDQNSRSLVRLCANVVQFKSHRFGTNSSITLSEQLTRAIDRHLRELTASAAGLRLVVGANTSGADTELPQLVLETNQALWNLVQPFQTGDPDGSTPSVMYGLLPDCPTPLHLGRATRAKSNQDDSGSSVYDELWSLGDELVNSLIPSSSVPSSHSLAPLTCPDLVSHLARFHRTCRRRWAVKRLEASLSDDKLHLNTEYVGRLRVLEELGFIDAAVERGCLSLKGLVACELQQMEVLLTQLLLEGSFTQLPAADIAALLSCFVLESRTSDAARDEQSTSLANLLTVLGQSVQLDTVKNTKTAAFNSNNLEWKTLDVPEHLCAPVTKMFEFAANLESLQKKHGLADPRVDTQLNCSLVRATYAWATGHSFASLVQLTDMPEGNVVRGLLRLDELLRHICNACHRLGDQALGLRMNEARMAVHRDLVCAPSLYISEDFTYKPDVSV